MAITASVYGQAYKGFGMARFDVTSQTFNLALVTAAYVPNLDTHEFYSQITGETTGVGYTTGGKALTGVQWAYANHAATLTAAPVTWTSATFTCRYGVIYRVGADRASSPLLILINFGANASVTSAPFPVTFANGVFALGD